MHYFFKEGALLSRGYEVSLEAGDVRHACRVLRLRNGDTVVVSDGRGTAYYGIISFPEAHEAKVVLKEEAPGGEPPLRITLLQGMAKGDKMDLILRQAVELGVWHFVPVLTERSISRMPFSREAGRLERWRKVARSAAAQCRRSRVPSVGPVISFKDALNMIEEKRCLVPWEREEKRPLRALLQQPPPGDRAVFLFIGPEGGFNEPEISSLLESGAATAHLGRRILRTESAAIACLALIQGAWGDLGVGIR